VFLPPPLPPLPPLPVSASRLLLLLLLIVAGVFLLPGLVSLFLPEAAFFRLPTVVGLFLAQSALMLLLTWLVVLRPCRLRLADIGLRPTYRAWYRLAFGAGFLCLPLVGAVNLLVQFLLGTSIENPQMQNLAPEGFSWTGLLLMLLLVGILVPVIEEIIFRGLVLGWLCRHLPFVFAVPINALLFSVVHGIPQLIPALAVMGLVLCAFALRSGSLWPAIVVHGTFNSLMTVSYYAVLAGRTGF